MHMCRLSRGLGRVQNGPAVLEAGRDALSASASLPVSDPAKDRSSLTALA
jgi:hypothetical protein